MKEVLIKILAVLILAGLFLALDGLIKESSPVSAALNMFNFGGRIYSIFPCTCDESYIVYIGNPKGGAFMYQPYSSRTYSWYNVRPGVWAKGLYLPGEYPCLNPVCKGACCPNNYAYGLILTIGTSFR